MHHWHILPDADAVAQAAAELLAESIWRALDELDLCHVALPGGTTPAACLQRLAAMELPWGRIHWYLGDERCLPIGDAERNDTLLNDCLWTQAAIPEENCHRMRAELGPVDAAVDYSEQLSLAGHLDMVLLGMGEDGHTASLFPDNAALSLAETVVPVFDSPKPPPERVTLSIPTIEAAGLRVALISGAGKADALARVRAGESLPINRVGPLEIFADSAAAGESPA